MEREECVSFMRDVDGFCKELRPIEEVCYVEHTFSDQVIPLCKTYGLLGISVKEYGGRGADSFNCAHALDRIGMEGTGIRTFFLGCGRFDFGPVSKNFSSAKLPSGKDFPADHSVIRRGWSGSRYGHLYG